jgi:hypothetical protein
LGWGGDLKGQHVPGLSSRHPALVWLAAWTQHRIRPLGVPWVDGVRPTAGPGPILTEGAKQHGHSNLNVAELVNLCCERIEQVLHAARAGIGRIRHEAQVAVLALRRVGLAPWRWLPSLGKPISRLAGVQPIR